jgi:aspartate/methionine/tyrosine aminotransferase
VEQGGRPGVCCSNSPHNPTGATIGDGEMEALHDFTAERGIQLVSDEVYHPIYHGRQMKSAARLPYATVIADLSRWCRAAIPQEDLV